MGLRRAHSYRRIERAYTRISKYREEAFVRSRPHMLITKFDTGDTKRQFETYKYNLNLLSNVDQQIRHNALEAARAVSNRILEQGVGKSGYHLRMRLYPHHILRENVMASGAGADRVSQGMSASFGKPMSTACQVRTGQSVIILGIDNKNHLEIAKKALKKASCKFPASYKIVITELAVAKAK
jgi:large subunit ribosomal protein L10e